MKCLFSFSLVFPLVVAFGFNGCNRSASITEPNPLSSFQEQPDPVNEDAGILIPDSNLIAYTETCFPDRLGKASWSETIHDNYVYLCAKQLGLSETRAALMQKAAHMPDVFQSGFDHGYNQQWSHAFMIKKTWWGPQWVWGDADGDFYDNLNGDSGEFESPEGYNGKCAGEYYALFKRDLGDWYVGYACHYIADVCLLLHTTIPDYDLAMHHFDFETWVQNNWSAGFKFKSTAEAVPASSYYTFTDPKAAIVKAAINANTTLNANAKLAWYYYKASGFPTTAGTGSGSAAVYTRKMVEEAVKWTGGSIQYALDKYRQW